MIENKNLPAYPQSMTELNGVLTDTMDYSPASAGFSKREEIAKAALQGLLSNPNYFNLTTRVDIVASDAVTLADALFAELSKPQP